MNDKDHDVSLTSCTTSEMIWLLITKKAATVLQLCFQICSFSSFLGTSFNNMTW